MVGFFITTIMVVEHGTGLFGCNMVLWSSVASFSLQSPKDRQESGKADGSERASGRVKGSVNSGEGVEILGFSNTLGLSNMQQVGELALAFVTFARALLRGGRAFGKFRGRRYRRSLCV